MEVELMCIRSTSINIYSSTQVKPYGHKTLCMDSRRRDVTSKLRGYGLRPVIETEVMDREYVNIHIFLVSNGVR